MKKNWMGVFFVVCWLYWNGAFASSPQHTPFVVLTPPKCGTHLVGKALQLILEKEPAYYLGGLLQNCEIAFQEAQKNNQFIVSHSFDLEFLQAFAKSGYKVIFILRDPRDQLLSVADWLQEGQWPWLPASQLKNREDLVNELITGEKFNFRSYENCMALSLLVTSSLPETSCYTVRFENLVGNQGGGSGASQFCEIRRLSEFLGVKLSINEIQNILPKLYGNTRTFRKGQVGCWKLEFLPYQKEIYKQHYGDLLIALKYEEDINW